MAPNFVSVDSTSRRSKIVCSICSWEFMGVESDCMHHSTPFYRKSWASTDFGILGNPGTSPLRVLRNVGESKVICRFSIGWWSALLPPRCSRVNCNCFLFVPFSPHLFNTLVTWDITYDQNILSGYYYYSIYFY